MYIGSVVAIIMIAFMYFIPTVFSPYEITSCSPESVTEGFCRNRNVWLGMAMFIVGMISLFGSPFGLGAILAAYHRRIKVKTRQMFLSLGISTLIFLTIPALFEIIWYEPWKSQYLPDGTAFSAYQLDAIFITLFVIPLILAILISYLATTDIMALWAKLPRVKPMKKENS